MTPTTAITINIEAGALVLGMVVFFLALLGIIWKGKSEIASAIKGELNPFRNMASAITEMQTILMHKFTGLTINHSMTEVPGSPLKPTEYGAQLIRDSGLEKILDDNKALLCEKLRASLAEGYTEYDVQEEARHLLLLLKDDQIMRQVKEYVYNHPIDIEVILRTGGLWLRDDFLNHPREVAKNEGTA